MTISQKNSVYFPGLNALRFFAAFAVIITHVELMKKYLSSLYGFSTGWMDFWGVWNSGPEQGQLVVEHYPLDTILHHDQVHWYHPLISEAGPLGVVFFFVLSGFLITYLLFKEKELSGTIGIRDFYFRRIFRIWPLYYFIILLGFFVLPLSSLFYVPVQSDQLAADFASKLGWSMIILPNVAMAFYATVPNIGQIWSIGVEEQFYLIWPWLIRKFGNPLRMMAIFFIGWMLIKAGVILFHRFQPGIIPVGILKLLAMTKLESMAIGGVGAWLLFSNHHLIQIVFRPVVQLTSLLAIPVLLYFTPRVVQDGIHLLHSVFFLIVILNVAANKQSVLKLENRFFHELGKISYGMYMYHLMVVVAVLHLAAQFFPSLINTWGGNAVIYLTCVVVTSAISYLSYHYFEYYFIRLKQRFTKVVSGDDAKKA